MQQVVSRGTFNTHLAAVAAAKTVMPHTVLSRKSRDIHIGHTGITWLNAAQYEANRQIGQFGFCGYETFSLVLERFDNGRQLQGMVESELDDLNGCNPDPTPPHRLVGETVSYLKSIGVKLRT